MRTEIRPHEAEVDQIKLIDEQVNAANKITLTDPAFQKALSNALDETGHATPPGHAEA